MSSSTSTHDTIPALLVTSSSHTHSILSFPSLTPLHTIAKSACVSRAATFIQQTQNIVIIGDKGQILVFSLDKEPPLYQCVQNEPLSVLCHSESHLFAGSRHGSIFIWDLYSGELWFVAKQAHMKSVSTIAYHEATGFLISASEDASVRVWNLMKLMDIRTEPEVAVTRAIVHEWSAHSLKVTSIYTGESIVATGSLDRSVKLWDIASGEELCSISFPAAIQDVKMSPDEKIIYAACSNGFIYEVSLYGTGFDIRYLDSNHVSAIVKPVTSLVGGRRQLLVEHRATSKKTAASQNGNAGSDPFNFEEYKTLVQNQYSMCYVYQGHTNAVTSISISPDGTRLSSCSLDGTLIVWDIQSRQPVRTTKKGTGSTEAQFTNVCNISISQQARQHKVSLRRTFKKFVSADPGSEVMIQNYDIHSNWRRLWSDERDQLMDMGTFGDSKQLSGGLSHVDNLNVRRFVQSGQYVETNPNLTISEMLDHDDE